MASPIGVAMGAGHCLDSPGSPPYDLSTIIWLNWASSQYGGLRVLRR